MPLLPQALRPAPFLSLTAVDIQVEVLGKEIVVTRPGTDFMIEYRKRSDSPTLKLTRSWVGPHITSPAISEFRAKAFRAAVNKARELPLLFAKARSHTFLQ